MLLETLGDLDQPATTACDRVGFHEESDAVGYSVDETEFVRWDQKAHPTK
jgi:hypothetical protein